MIKNSKNRNKLEKKWKEDEAFQFYKKQKYMKITICLLEIIKLKNQEFLPVWLTQGWPIHKENWFGILNPIALQQRSRSENRTFLNFIEFFTFYIQGCVCSYKKISNYGCIFDPKADPTITKTVWDPWSNSYSAQ